LKEFLNPKGSTSSKWLSSKVLEAAQPSEGYQSRIIVTNSLDKSWEPGNLDATIVIELEKDGKTISKTFETTSTLVTNGLLNHVKYEPVTAPTTVEVTLSKFLKGQKDLEITLNGEKVKPGKYFAIPGVYKTKAAGYKLVAPTESAIYVENESQLVRIGQKVELPKGGAAKLDKAIQSKAERCLKVTNTGTGPCFKTQEIISAAETTEVEKVPAEYFDYRDYNFKSGIVTCENDGRKDSLVSATVAVSKTNCYTEVTFSRDYYKSSSRQVPKYVTKPVCAPGNVTPNGDRAFFSYTDEWEYFENIYKDTNGNLWLESSLIYDSCAYKVDKLVRDGTKTELVRGDKIASTKMKSSLSKSQTAKGTLLANGDFKVTW
jgi:hypothetical protein